MLKKIIPLSLFLSASVLAPGSLTVHAAQDEADTDQFDFEHVSCKGELNEVRIVITGIKDSAGLVVADMYPNREENFLRGKGRIKKVKFAARAPVTKFCMTTPEDGKFAIAIYQDRNANGEFDKNGLGLPAEPWGLSNNPKIRFKAPSAKQTVFDVSADGAKVKIDLN